LIEKQTTLAALRERVQIRQAETSKIQILHQQQQQQQQQQLQGGAGSPNRPIVSSDEGEDDYDDVYDDDCHYSNNGDRSQMESLADQSLHAPQPPASDWSCCATSTRGGRFSSNRSSYRNVGGSGSDSNSSRQLALKQKLREKEAQFAQLRRSMEQQQRKR
jgi:hypothetical protein